MSSAINEDYIGYNLQPEVKNIIRLSLAFAKAASNNQEDQGDNLLLSPYNALTALSMVAKAAGGESRAEMAQTLFNVAPELLDQEISKLTALNAQVLESNKDRVTLKTANAFWANSNQLPINPDYAADLISEFGADARALSFSDPATIDTMNAWASDNTNQLINEIVKKLSPDDLAILASALYFKGDWTNQFDPALTHDHAFTGDAVTELTRMMQQSFDEEGAVNYQEGTDYEAISLTYGKNDYDQRKSPSMRLVLVRPTDNNTSARDWLNTQANGKIPAWVDSNCYEEAVGQVRLPHMDIQQKHDLIPALKETGIISIFDSRAADLKRTTANGESPFISKVTHDVVFKTDEKGSEAAAVTKVEMAFECMQADPRNIDVIIDRSFVLMLQDIDKGLPLFIGVVNKPNTAMKPVKATALTL